MEYGGFSSDDLGDSCPRNRTEARSSSAARASQATRRTVSEVGERRAAADLEGKPMTKEPFSEDELSRIEREHPKGLSSEEIVHWFTDRGIKFTEASLRKYIQLGLLPRSRRVGMKGKQRGSQGMYPATVVRRIQRLKLMMETHSIEQIQKELLFVRGDVEELETTLERIFSALSTRAKGSRAAMRDLTDAKVLASELVAKVTSIETRMTMQARLEREAV